MSVVEISWNLHILLARFHQYHEDYQNFDIENRKKKIYNIFGNAYV